MNGPIRDLIRMPGEVEASEIARDDVDAKVIDLTRLHGIIFILFGL